MVTPAAKRKAVARLKDAFGMSEGRTLGCANGSSQAPAASTAQQGKTTAGDKLRNG